MIAGVAGTDCCEGRSEIGCLVDGQGYMDGLGQGQGLGWAGARPCWDWLHADTKVPVTTGSRVDVSPGGLNCGLSRNGGRPAARW